MLIIRLRRIGKKNKPAYRVVVAEHTYPVDGKFTADVGFYNPHTKKIGIKVDEVKLWLDKGAKPSNTVARLLQKEKVKHNSVVVIQKTKKLKAETAPKAEKPVAAAAGEEASSATETEGTDTAVETPVETEVTAEGTVEPIEPAEEASAPDSSEEPTPETA